MIAQEMYQKDAERNDPKTSAWKQYVIARAYRGKAVFENLQSGDYVVPYGDKELSTVIIDLLHFFQDVEAKKNVFNQWNDELRELDKDLSESAYLKAAKMIQDETNVIESDSFKQFVSTLLYVKTKGDFQKATRILGICNSIVSSELVEAGLVKSN